MIITGLNNYLLLAAALLSGGLLGLFYFGGLWLTVQKLKPEKTPALLLVVSYILRLGLTLVGFYLVSGGQIARLLVSLAGFIIARQLLIRHIRPVTERSVDTYGNQP